MKLEEDDSDAELEAIENEKLNKIIEATNMFSRIIPKVVEVIKIPEVEIVEVEEVEVIRTQVAIDERLNDISFMLDEEKKQSETEEEVEEED